MDVMAFIVVTSADTGNRDLADVAYGRVRIKAVG